MDGSACNVIYVNKNAKDAILNKASLLNQSGPVNPVGKSAQAQDDVHSSSQAILSVFSSVTVSQSGSSCMSSLLNLDTHIPTLVIIDIPTEDERSIKHTLDHASIFSSYAVGENPRPLDGSRFLSHLHSEIKSRNLSAMVIPVAVIAAPEPPLPHAVSSYNDDVSRITQIMDCGAADVVVHPLTKDKVLSLASHAYRIYKQAPKSDNTVQSSQRTRKASCPYYYLREALVSNLMNGICSPESSVAYASNDSSIQRFTSYRDWERKIDRKDLVTTAIGSWLFSAHELTDDEILYAAMMMLQHATRMHQLAEWRLHTDDLFNFLQACCASYNDFVLYHNFRHVVDVLQACFAFLLAIGVLSPFPNATIKPATDKKPLAALLTPFDGLCLLISAVGHDVGHPGVNNAFLKALNAPIAQLYNDVSILESFHCAAYSQILRRHWPSVFKHAEMRKQMISSILATDMTLHFKFIAEIEKLQLALKDEDYISNLKEAEKSKNRELLCGLLIKCADISNVARGFGCARQWAETLTQEFASQAATELDLKISPSCLYGGPPVLDNVVKLGESQLEFMNKFASTLFDGVADLVPCIAFTVEQLEHNKATWQKIIADADVTAASHTVPPTSSAQTNTRLSSSYAMIGRQSPSAVSTARTGPSILSPRSTTSGTGTLSSPVVEGTSDRDRSHNRGRNSNRSGSNANPQNDALPFHQRRASSAHHTIPIPLHGHAPTQPPSQLPAGSQSAYAASETDIGFADKDDKSTYNHGGPSDSHSGGTSDKASKGSKRLSGFRKLFRRKKSSDQKQQGSRQNIEEENVGR